MKKAKKLRDFNRGFTLIELMVVVAIIGILTAILMANFAAAESRSRDDKRISDLSQIQTALAAYFDRCDSYPLSPLDTTPGLPPCYPSGPNLSTFMSTIPNPPRSTDVYNYVPDSNRDDYFLSTTLENPGSPSNNSLSQVPSWYPESAYAGTQSGIVCNTNDLNYCVGPK